ncbi:TolC family protein [Bacteroidales bacterium OttesenSCG-928-B11]|nr:TolC family protein [Bacteroidales bacterium OttesenSCG-928-B11]MDL2326462.1 TolC family protein [Bacteroidales bacterium OttesenSCG-928-A14]
MRIFIVLFLVFISLTVSSQTVLSLDNCIQIAQGQSVEAKQAKNNYLIASYDYKLYRKSLLPSLTLSGSLPAFNRTISTITLPDGTEAFVSQSVGNYSGTFSLSQAIPFTGGQLFVSTGLQRLDIYQDGTTTSYLANLVNVGINQSIIAYNPYKWKKKIEPLQYQQSERDYIEKLQDAALLAINHYFELLTYQVSLELTIQNKINNDTLLQIAKERFALGKITEDELLEVEVNDLTLSLQIEELQNDWSEKQAALADFLGYPTHEEFTLLMPFKLAIEQIDQAKAEEEAKRNGVAEVDYRRRLLVAQSELAQAKADRGFSVDLYASFGLSQSDALFKNAYKSPLDQEQITLSFTIPILDWGVAKHKRKRAEVTLNNATLSIEQEQMDFYRNLRNTIRQYNLQLPQLKLMERRGELSNKRFEMSRERYMMGKINFLDYSVAQNEKDNAQLDYIVALQKSWAKYYEIRKYTLYDFLHGRKIEVEL